MNNKLGSSEPKSLVDLLTKKIDSSPDKVVFSFLPEGESIEAEITFGELDRRARFIAAQLQDYNLRGERAILLFHPGIEYICAFMGCQYAGVIAVPAYPPRNV